jgi:uncharacterized RDD family membrane protein YckC
MAAMPKRGHGKHSWKKLFKPALDVELPKVKIAGHRVVAVPAPLGRRILAFIIDLILINIFLTAPFQKIIRGLIPDATSYGAIQAAMESNPRVAMAVFIIGAFSGIFTLLYFAILETKLGYTVGKLFMRIRVAALHKHELTFGKCVIRALFLIPIFPFILLWVVEPIYMLLSPVNQRLLEQWSHTITLSYVII